MIGYFSGDAILYGVQTESLLFSVFNPLTPNDHYSGRTALLTFKRCILYIYSTNIGTEYFKHGIYSSFFSLKNAVFFHNSNVFGSCIIHISYTGVLKLKKNNSGAKRLMCYSLVCYRTVTLSKVHDTVWKTPSFCETSDLCFHVVYVTQERKCLGVGLGWGCSNFGILELNVFFVRDLLGQRANTFYNNK